jgi:hypothetical protein
VVYSTGVCHDLAQQSQTPQHLQGVWYQSIAANLMAGKAVLIHQQNVPAMSGQPVRTTRSGRARPHHQGPAAVIGAIIHARLAVGTRKIIHAGHTA